VSFKIAAKSNTADKDYNITYQVNATLIIQVQELPKPTTTSNEKTGDTFLITLGLLILIIIIVLVIVFALMKKKKKPPEEKPTETAPIQSQPPPDQPQSIYLHHPLNSPW